MYSYKVYYNTRLIGAEITTISRLSKDTMHFLSTPDDCTIRAFYE